MNKTSNRKIVVLGGYGAFGSLISDQVAKFANVVIAGRNQATGEKFANSIGAGFSSMHQVHFCQMIIRSQVLASKKIAII